MSLRDSLNVAAQLMRELALAYDAEAARILERGFHFWQAETLMPAAVNRWIVEIGKAL